MEQSYGWTALILIHAVAAGYAMIFGAVNLFRKTKGDKVHKIIGYIWVLAMYFVIISSFWIRTIRPGQFSWIHGLSIYTLFTVTTGLVAAFRKNIKAHMNYLRGSYFGLLGAFVGVVAFPSRLIPQTAIHHTGSLVLYILAVSLSASFFVVATVQLFSRRTKHNIED